MSTACSNNTGLAGRKRRKTVGIISLGCAKNLVDTERLMYRIDPARFRVILEPENFRHLDALIINTCGFIGDAKEESVNTILRYTKARKQGRIERLFVMGCLSQRYKEELRAEIPEADGFFGVNEQELIVRDLGAIRPDENGFGRSLSTPGHYAFLKIAEGCNRKCSFCAIPGIRGPHHSRPFNDIIREAEWLVAKGVKEIILISQDTTYYGIDLNGKRLLPDLAARIAEIPGLSWLRIQYTYPGGFPLRLLDVMASHPNICRYIDMPLQHISNRILRSMKRGISVSQTRKLLALIREKLPEAAIRTTFITGYPSETQREFMELVQFINDFRFDRVGVFPYSEEEHTPAASLLDNIPFPLKKRRMEQIMEVQRNIAERHNSTLVGKKIKVVIDRREGKYLVGRSEYDSPEVDNEVLVSAPAIEIPAGSFRNIRITAAEAYDLYGVFD